jgi:hypothetical protein
MTDKQYDPNSKWGAPTSSYEDAKSISKFLKAAKEKEAVEKNKQKET